MTTKAASLVIAAAMFSATPALASGQTFYNACSTAIGQFFNSVSCDAEITNLASEIASAPHPAICFPARFKPEQSTQAIRAYMTRHPEGAIRSESNIVYNALMEAYPCP
jgi:Rap1a immunity proteins